MNLFDSRVTLLNFRGDHATNSSSSHSWILFPVNRVNTSIESDAVDAEFGWSDFTISSEDGKAMYVAVALRDSLGRDIPSEMANIIVREMAGVVPPADGYIDHQSMPTIPSDYHKSNYPDMAYFADFKRWALHSGVTILGGTDNSDPHPDYNEKTARKGSFLNDVGRSRECVARYDATGLYWAIFNRISGAKMRIAFPDNGLFQTDNPRSFDMNIDRAFAPELVDLKITDACPFVSREECGKYCYQASQTGGVHADLWAIDRILNALSQLKVFEIAIGGGEPTLHPDFVEILATARDKGISPNFTTRNLKWIEDDQQRNAILKNASAFAYSAHKPSDIVKLAALLKKHNVDTNRVNVHIVLGTMSRERFEEMLNEAAKSHLRVTLLAFKNTGHGEEYKKIDYSWWIDVVKNMKTYIRVCIDTPLAAEFDSELQNAGVPNWMYYTTEGRFSAYYNAVEGYLAPSSFEADDSNRYYLSELRGNRRTIYSEEIANWILKTYPKFP